MDSVQNFYNSYCTSIFLLRMILIVVIPKSIFLAIIFRVFMWLISLINAGPRSIMQLQCFEMVSKIIHDHLLQVIWTMKFLCHPLILQLHLRRIKNLHATFKIKMKNIDSLLKQRMMRRLILGQKYLPLYWNH